MRQYIGLLPPKDWTIMRIGIALLAVVSGFSAATPISPQVSTKHIADRPACRQCRIERYLVANIDESAYPGILDISTVASSTSDGRFVLTSFISALPHLTDETGRVTRQIGRQGEGPGEYRLATDVVEAPDGFLIYDRRLNRLARYSRDFAFQEMLPGPRMRVLSIPLVLPNGIIVINGEPLSPQDRTPTLRLVGRDGRVIRAIGRQREPMEDPRLLVTPSRDGTLLLAPAKKYRIERWDTLGHLLDVYERDADWFPSQSIGEQGGPSITSIREDSAGLLWVHITHYYPKPPGPPPYPITGATTIEVIDLKQSQLLTSTRIENWRIKAVGGRLLVSTYGESEADEPQLRIWGFRLRR